MKSLWGKLGVILIGLAIFGYGEVWGADWKHFSSTDLYECFYYAEGMTRYTDITGGPPKNIARVWIKLEYTEKGIDGMVKKFGKEYENLSYSIYLKEINCVEKTDHHLSMTHYDNKGGVIYFSSSFSKWDFIAPETMGESLYKEVCK